MIKTVELHNIRNFDHAKFTFGKGITVLTGDNGSGKSTILNSISYALTDKHTAKMRSFVNKKNTQEPAWIRIEVGNLDIKKTITTTTQGKKVSLEIWDCGKEIRLNTVTDMKDYILKELGIEPYLFLNGIYVGQGSDIDLLIRPASAKLFLINLFNLTDYMELEKKAKQLVSGVSGEIRSNKAQILGLSTSITEINEEDILTLNTEIDGLQNQLDNDKEKLNDMRNTRIRLETVYRESAVLETEKIKLAEQLNRCNVELNELPEDIQPDSVEALTFEYDYVVAQKKENREIWEKLTSRMGYQKGILDKISKAGEKCPVCETTLTLTVRKSKITEKHARISALQTKLDLCTKLYRDWDTAEGSLQTSIYQADKKAELENEIAQKERELHQLPASEDTDFDILQHIQETCDNQAEVVTETTSKLKIKEALREELVKQHYHYTKIMGTISNLDESNLKLEKRLEQLSILAQAYGKDGIPKRVIETSMTRLESEINSNLSVITDGEMSLEFVTWKEGKEVFEVYVYHNGWYYPYQELSGGEGKKVLVSAMLGLSDFIETDIPFRLGDEIDVWLDSNGVANLKELLISKKKKYPQIILASHDLHLIDIADKLIEL